jgi:hypothetical protein
MMKHRQRLVRLVRQVFVDEDIAPEIMVLNLRGLYTEASCQGPPPTALIRPSMVRLARKMKYSPVYQGLTGMYQIKLKTTVPRSKAKDWDKIVKWLNQPKGE